MIRLKLSLQFIRDARHRVPTLFNVKCSLNLPFNRTTKACLIVATVLISLAVKPGLIDF